VEFFPTPSVAMLKATNTTSHFELSRTQDKTGTLSNVPKCAVTHRVERLIHLELEDRFGGVNISPDGCQCGKVHKEWFRSGTRGWPDVRDVIVRWIGFAKTAYGEVV
jgi:hypothetical protein